MKQKLPAYLDALNGFHGIGPNGVVEYSIAGDPMLHWLRNRYWTIFYDAFLVPDIVESPLKIWQDLSRVGTDDFLCIAGVPTLKFARKHLVDSQIALQEGRVFLAFASDDFVISKWRWENVDSDGSGLPSSHNARFGKEIWPR